jgi:hypothetical protein
MKTKRYETWGVHLGRARSCMGGTLVIWPDNRIKWIFDHINVRHLLETGESVNYGHIW